LFNYCYVQQILFFFISFLQERSKSQNVVAKQRLISYFRNFFFFHFKNFPVVVQRVSDLGIVFSAKTKQKNINKNDLETKTKTKWFKNKNKNKWFNNFFCCLHKKQNQNKNINKINNNFCCLHKKQCKVYSLRKQKQK
jgi:hypothetical protein